MTNEYDRTKYYNNIIIIRISDQIFLISCKIIRISGKMIRISCKIIRISGQIIRISCKIIRINLKSTIIESVELPAGFRGAPRLCLPPPGTPAYTPTPIAELKKRKSAEEPINSGFYALVREAVFFRSRSFDHQA